jgi:hypothetical protein
MSESLDPGEMAHQVAQGIASMREALAPLDEATLGYKAQLIEAGWSAASARCDAELAILDLHTPTSQPHIVCSFCAGGDPFEAADPDWPCRTLVLLSQGYQHRPGFKEEWRG